MLAEYMDKAMRHADFKRLEDGTIFGSIPGFQGVWADATTEDECRAELREVLKDGFCWASRTTTSGRNSR